MAASHDTVTTLRGKFTVRLVSGGFLNFTPTSLAAGLPVAWDISRRTGVDFSPKRRTVKLSTDF
jgi:hypothetical protein